MWEELKAKGIRPYYEDESVIIINDDCRNVLPLLDDHSIDLVLTDPPYGIDKADWDSANFIETLGMVRDKFLRLTKEGSLAFIWMPKNNLYGLSQLDFKFDVFIETKNFAQSRPHSILIDCWVPILMMSNGKHRKIKGDGLGKNWFMVNSANTSKKDIDNPRNIEHPTVKDTELVKYLVKCSSLEDELILDPFLGSGTTAYCAKKLGRKCIGIEIEEAYCRIAKERCSQSVMKLGV